jgi:hypothetical protein
MLTDNRARLLISPAVTSLPTVHFILPALVSGSRSRLTLRLNNRYRALEMFLAMSAMGREREFAGAGSGRSAARRGRI